MTKMNRAPVAARAPRRPAPELRPVARPFALPEMRAFRALRRALSFGGMTPKERRAPEDHARLTSVVAALLHFLDQYRRRVEAGERVQGATVKRSRYQRAATALAAAAVGLLPAAARAQSTPTFAVDRLVVAGAPGDGFAVWRPEVSEKTRFYGQLGLGLAVNPLRVDNYVDNLDNAKQLKNPLELQFITYLDVGVEILNRASIQVSFPFVAYQAGNPSNVRVGAGKVPLLPQGSVTLQSVAPGDLRIEGRVIIFRSASRAFKLGASAAVLLPTGNRLSFAGDGAVGASFGLAAEVDFKAAYLTLNAGYRLRPTVVINELLVGSEVVYGLGAYVPLGKGALRFGAEVFGGFGASASTAKVYTTPTATVRGNVGDLDTTPLEWQLNFKGTGPSPQVYIGWGGGSRLTGGYAPDFRTVVLVGGWFSPR